MKKINNNMAQIMALDVAISGTCALLRKSGTNAADIIEFMKKTRSDLIQKDPIMIGVYRDPNEPIDRDVWEEGDTCELCECGCKCNVHWSYGEEYPNHCMMMLKR
jgi:hypothetical protein